MTGKINRATWFPQWLVGSWIDITHIDFDELWMFTDPLSAYDWVGYENGKQ